MRLYAAVVAAFLASAEAYGKFVGVPSAFFNDFGFGVSLYRKRLSLTPSTAIPALAMRASAASSYSNVRERRTAELKMRGGIPHRAITNHSRARNDWASQGEAAGRVRRLPM